MIRINIFEAKARLSEFLDAVDAGERVVICKRNRPVAELTKVSATRTTPRPVGGAAGQFSVPATFFDPLPDDLLESFHPVATLSERPMLVAERGPGLPALRAKSTGISRRGRR